MQKGVDAPIFYFFGGGSTDFEELASTQTLKKMCASNTWAQK